MQVLSRATSAITKQYGLLLRSSNKGNHCITFILPALIKFYSFKAKSIFSHENDNSCHIKFPTVLMACNMYAPRTYFELNYLTPKVGSYIKLKLLKSCICGTIFKTLSKSKMLKTFRGNLPYFVKLTLFSYF